MGNATARRVDWRAGLGEFADCLLVGLLVALASLPVVTAPPALAAGCRALDRARHGIVRPLWTTFWADFRGAARGGVAFGATSVAVAVLVVVDLEVASAMPGAGVLRPALGALGVVAAVVAVRACQVVAAGEPVWRRAAVTAARETAARPRDALLTATALAVSALLVWMLPVLALVVAGPLALAAVATGGRR